jgi:hypothetical protein
MGKTILLHLLMAFVLMAGKKSLAQSVNENLPMVRKELFASKGFYRFSGFSQGTVILKNGIVTSGMLNYNISLNEMHFINQKGDTLAIAQPDSINFISLNGCRFYYDMGYLQSINTGNDIILAFRQVLKTEHQKKESYSIDIPRSDEEITEYSFFTGNGQKYDLGANDQLFLTATEQFFFGDEHGRFKKAGKEYIFQHYEKHQAAVKEFLKTNHTSFNKLAGILQLLQFCSKLE